MEQKQTNIGEDGKKLAVLSEGTFWMAANAAYQFQMYEKFFLLCQFERFPTRKNNKASFIRSEEVSLAYQFQMYEEFFLLCQFERFPTRTNNKTSCTGSEEVSPKKDSHIEAQLNE